MSETNESTSGLSRRKLIGAAGIGALAVGAGGGYAVGRQDEESTAGIPDPDAKPIPFEGVHQAGIVTPAQDRLYFVALDMTSDERADLISLLKDWTAAARQMAQGNDVGEFERDGSFDFRLQRQRHRRR
jgi:deferrochelatase/peroxidase EfeB